MSYDYKSSKDLVTWCVEQKSKPNKYRLGGIGRYDNGVRIFDCIGMIKCFMWKNYHQNNARYYGKNCPDKNCNAMFEIASEKGCITSIPETPGLIVYQRGHVGVYMGKGKVIECTASFGGKIVYSYFKGNNRGNRRDTWTHWFKMPGLNYDTTTNNVDKAAEEVIRGKWGNGSERKEKLTKAGYDYKAVQKRVNEILDI